MRIFRIMIVTFLSLGSLQVAAKSDDDKGIYLNAYLEKVDGKKSAEYYCELVEQTDAGFHYKAFYMSGELKMEGWYLDEDMEVSHGVFTYYYKSGQIESSGEYLDDVKFGLWVRYAENGLEKPEKLYASAQMMKAVEDQKEK